MTNKQKVMLKNAGLGMATLVVTGVVIGLFDKLTGINNIFEKIIESGLYLTGVAGAIYFGIFKMKKDIKNM